MSAALDRAFKAPQVRTFTAPPPQYLQHALQLADARALGHLAGHAVAVQRYELQLRCGAMRWLHDVLLAGAPALYLRALHRGGAQYSLFDLRHLAPELQAELPLAAPIDRWGYVLYTLRGRYARMAELERVLEDAALASGELQPGPAA